MTATPLLTRVVVAGRDAPLWLAAAVVARGLGPAGVRVVAAELPTRLRPSDVCATLPALEALHARLKVDEAALIRAAAGAYSLGQNFVDGTGSIRSFFHAWGSYGTPIEGRPFFQHWLRARHLGLDAPFQDFCPTAVAASNGRMLLPDADTAAFGRADYGYHMNAQAYSRYMKSVARALGVETHEADSLDIELDGAGETIAAVVLDGGRRFEAQFFIDATGEDGRLIASLGAEWESWRGQFPADRALAAEAPASAPVPAFAEIRASEQGWTVLHPCRRATGVAHFYSSDLQSDEDALKAAGAVSGANLSYASVAAKKQGRRLAPWRGNCVAVGAAACAFDPVHDVDLHAVQLGLVHLMSLFPRTESFAAERIEYNRRLNSSFDRVRDFQRAFYALAPFKGAFWNKARSGDTPPSLAHKIATFSARAEIAPLEDESFDADSWRALFLGLGATPESWPPAVDRVPPERLNEEFRRVLGFIKTKILEQPAHDAYLRAVDAGAAS